MPEYRLDEGERIGLAVFLRGLRALAPPSTFVFHREGAAWRGLAERSIDGRGCRQCHLLDGKPPAIAQFYADAALAPPPLDGAGARLQPQWLFDYLIAPSAVRPWLQVRMPNARLGPAEAEAIARWLADRAGRPTALRPLAVRDLSPERAEVGRQAFVALKCVTCHRLQRGDGLTTADLAPDLGLARQRLDPEWIRRFLEDPGKILPHTKMPQFSPDGQSPLPDLLAGDSAAQMDLIVDHLMHLGLLPTAGAPPQAEAP